MSQWFRVAVSVLAALISSTYGVEWDGHSDGKAEAQHGASLALTCIYGGTFDGFYKKNENTEEKLVNGGRVIITEGFTGSHDLEIKDVVESDYGTYVCKNSNNESAELLISIGAAIEKPTSPQIIPFAKVGTIKAVVWGMPRPSITWSLNGKNIVVRRSNGNIMGDKVKYGVSEEGALSINDVGAGDSGTYQVYIKKGATKISEDIVVETGAVPKISKGLEASYSPLNGASLTLPCEWSDAPTDLKWTFTDSTGTTTDVTEGVDNTKGLTIAAVTKASVGTYTCSGSSKFGSDSSTGKIEVVLFPPSISSNFNATYVKMMGESFKQECEATGEPGLKMSWKKFQEDGSMTNFAPEEASGKIEMSIKALELTDSGKYGCFAEIDTSNPDVTAASKVFVISVVSKPNIVSISEDIDSAMGKSVVARCSASGTPLPAITFHRGDTLLAAPKRSDHDGITDASLELTMTKEHFGEITCKAKNDHGDASKSFTITEIVKASVPVLKQDLDYGVEYIKVEWGKPTGTVDKYLVERVSADVAKPEVMETTKLEMMYTNLNKNTKYTFRVAAVNIAGTTDYSQPITIKTKDIKLAAPTNVKATAGRNSVMLEWSALTGPVVEYVVSMKEPRGDVVEDTVKETSFKKTGLTKGTTYTFKVVGVSDTGLQGNVSQTVRVTTLTETPPTKPYLPQPKVKGTTVSISWQAPLNAANDPIKYFIVRCQLNRTVEISCENVEETTDKSVSMDGLKPETKYRVKITAVNQDVIGETAVLDVTTEKKEEDRGTTTLPSKKGLSGGAVAGIVIAIILIILIVIDLFCCFFNNFGFTHCCFETFCSSKTKGKYAPADSKDAEAQELKAPAETENVV